MITAEMKDRVLKCLCENAQTEAHVDINTKVFLTETRLEFNDLNSILSYFERLGFLEDLNCRQSNIFLTLKIEANDFFLRGGFIGQEVLLKSNIEKLLLEVEHLEKQLGPNNLETVNKLSTIASAIMSGLSLFK